MTTCMTEGATLARACTPLTKSEEKERLEYLITFCAVKGSKRAEAPSPSFALDPTNGSGNNIRRTLRKTSIGKESSERES